MMVVRDEMNFTRSKKRKSPNIICSTERCATEDVTPAETESVLSTTSQFVTQNENFSSQDIELMFVTNAY